MIFKKSVFIIAILFYPFLRWFSEEISHMNMIPVAVLSWLHTLMGPLLIIHMTT